MCLGYKYAIIFRCGMLPLVHVMCNSLLHTSNHIEKIAINYIFNFGVSYIDFLSIIHYFIL